MLSPCELTKQNKQKKRKKKAQVAQETCSNGKSRSWTLKPCMVEIKHIITCHNIGETLSLSNESALQFHKIVTEMFQIEKYENGIQICGPQSHHSTPTPNTQVHISKPGSYQRGGRSFGSASL